MTVTLDAKRRLTLPASLISAKPGEEFDVRYDADEDAIIFRRLPSKENWLDVLAQCPVPMDDIPPRSRDLPRKPKL